MVQAPAPDPNAAAGFESGGGEAGTIRSLMPLNAPSPRRLPLSYRRAFVQRHTRLRDVDGVPGVRLHLAGAAEPVWLAAQEALGVDGAPMPFWAFAWAGGLALAGWLQAHPDEVSGRSVLDFATGSGLVAIVAAQAGAAHVRAVDIDPFAEAAVALNARANHVHVTYATRDLLDEPPPAVDVLLAADTWYEGPLAERVLPWLQTAAAAGTRVLVGDPGRKYLPPAADAGLVELAASPVRTTTTLEDREIVHGRVFVLSPQGPDHEEQRPMNSLVRDHLPATYFAEYQLLRNELMELLADDDLAFRPGADTLSLGQLCGEIGDIEHSYVEALRLFRQDFGWHHTDPGLERSVAALTAWYADLDRDLLAAVEALSEDDIATRRIRRVDYDVNEFSPLAAQELDVYPEALLIFYGKVSIYLRLMGRGLPRHWQEWIG